MTQKIYSYVLRYDNGAAPNPFWNICTLTICKPAIRRTAKIGDWVVGTGSTNTWVTKEDKVNLADHLVYAMKVTDKMTLEQYEQHCHMHLLNKIPIWKTNDWRLKIGDSIYHNFIPGHKPSIRKSVHNETNRDKDLSGLNALLSIHFYYFGLAAKELPSELRQLVKRNQGHRVIEQPDLIAKFEKWIQQFQKNKLYADPQLRWRFDREVEEDIISQCAIKDCEDDEDETFERVC
jgi:hypothetical protein